MPHFSLTTISRNGSDTIQIDGIYGVMDLKAIVDAGAENGVKHFFIEQDMVANPEVALKRSIDYLKSVHP